MVTRDYSGLCSVCVLLLVVNATTATSSIDPYTKKDWYDVKAPAMFTNRNLGKTLVTRTQGKSK